MKQLIPLLILFMFIAVPLSADLFYQMDITTQTMGITVTTTQRTYIQGDKMRQETWLKLPESMQPPPTPTTQITITRLDKRVLWQLNELTKTYKETPLTALLSQTTPLAESLFKHMDLDIQNLGPDTVHTYPCTKLQLTLTFKQLPPSLQQTFDKLQLTLWIGQPPGWQEYSSFYDKYRSITGTSNWQPLLGTSLDPSVQRKLDAATKDIQGMPLKLHTAIYSQNTILSSLDGELVQLSTDKLSPSLFELPAGYQKE